MKNIGLLLLLLTTFLIGAQAQKKAFHYSGTNWDKFNGHRLEISVLDTSIQGVKVITEGLIKEGKFKLKGRLSAIQNAYLGLYNPNGDFVYKQELIVEPGSLKIDYNAVSGNITVSGGKYNPFFEAIKNDAIYLEKVKSLKDYSAHLKADDLKDTVIRNQYFKLNADANVYKAKKFNDIRSSAIDPTLRLLAIVHSMHNMDYDDELDELEGQLGPHPQILTLRSKLRSYRESTAASQTITLGTTIKDFSASDLNGNEFHLERVIQKNKYTLVEFWASWCSPCRAEIPHMKTAYHNFKNDGFEIVSFTLDHERARWEKASTQENIPWINVGDLLAYKSPVVKLFGVYGVPANYLVDSTGKIIAMNLRQEQLDKKLEELLKKK